MADDLYPRVTVRDLPPEVAELREAKAAQEKELDEHWGPHIQAHIAALADEVDAAIEAHRHLADLTDLDLDADTGWSAIWLLSGRCLAICRVVLHDLRGGFASEAVGTLRSLWEAAMLLAALASSTEDELLRRWLVDDDKGWVRPKEARDAVVRKEARAWTRMEEKGVELPDESVEEAGRDIYDLLSRPAHHRRSGFPESRQVDLRVFAYGPHPQRGGSSTPAQLRKPVHRGRTDGCDRRPEPALWRRLHGRRADTDDGAAGDGAGAAPAPGVDRPWR